MNGKLKVVITGASSGIGFELARRYLENGAVVGLISRTAVKLAFFEDHWPDSAMILSSDVRNLESIQNVAGEFMIRFGCPDIVVANAGIGFGNLTEYAEDIESFQAIYDTNVIGVARTFQPFLRRMKAEGKGKLVGIASVAGFRGLPGASAYSSSKAAVINYLEGLRCELYGSGIKVITICPGY
ncbi:MAG TPA: SDR family NAD(P)-dependent oxidoreductase, partial [Burkholderiales bacterium]|nr:SDR family NAD(P)-dependent oxidoreductase [Burkholderiales bacterium]